MTEACDPLSEQLALHEAGHAVAAVALGFAVSQVRFEELADDEWVGETISTAAHVVPSDPNWVRRRDAAVVALAGREARRIKYPEYDRDWLPFERNDELRARHVLGVSESDAQAALDPIAAQAQQLVFAHRV